jgi:hypothetical protein
MPMILVSKLLSSLYLVLFVLAAPANAQNLLSCKSMTWQSNLDMKDASFFLDTEKLRLLRDTVKVSFNAVSDFQQYRAQEIRAETQRLTQDATALRAFMKSYSVSHHDLRVSMAIGFRPSPSEEYLNSDFRYFINTNMEMNYFRTLPNKNVAPLTSAELQKAAGIMQEFFALEMNLFENLLARNNAGLAQNHPLVQLQTELRSAKNLGEKLLNQNRTLQTYMIDKLREFRAQQRELSIMAILRYPPLSYTVTRSSVTAQHYQQAVDQIIQNGDREVETLRSRLDFWLSEASFAQFISQVQTRTPSHKKVTVAHGLSKLEAIFDYIPAVEEGTLQNPNACEVMERALAIHFKRLSNRQIGNMVLMVAALAVAPMITGPLLLTTTIVGSTALSIYSIQQESNNYRELVRATLTDIQPQSVDPQIYADLQAIEANIVAQQIFLPTLLPSMGFGLKSMLSMVRLKSLL